MAIAVRGVGTVDAAMAAISPGLPAGTAVDDILVMFVETNNQAITVAGWTEAGSSPQSEATDATRLTVFWRRATGSDATTTSDSGNHQIGRIIGFSGCVRSGNPFNVTTGSTEAVSDTTGSIPGATTTVANCMVIAACTINRDANNTANFSGWANASLASITEQIDNSTSAGLGGGIGAATGIKVAAGAYGATTVTYAVASRKALWSGALAPDSAQTITANRIVSTAALPNAFVNPGTVTITGNNLAATCTLRNAEVQNAASTQTITANLLTEVAGLTGGVVSTENQISANTLSASPTLRTPANISISILGATLLSEAALLPAAFVTTSYTIQAANLAPSATLRQGSVTTGAVSVTAHRLQVVPDLHTAAAIYLGSQYVFGAVLTVGVVASNWTADEASVAADGEVSVDGLITSTLPGATITQAASSASASPIFADRRRLRAGVVAAEFSPRLVRSRPPAMTR